MILACQRGAYWAMGFARSILHGQAFEDPECHL
jgi:hypothetical protein